MGSKPNSPAPFGPAATMWLAGGLLFLASQQAFYSLVLINQHLFSSGLLQTTIPLGVCAILVAAIRPLGPRIRLPVAYALFFSISATSLLGLTKTLTGSHAESDNYVLFGLSFYTASLGYLLLSNNLKRSAPLVVANPLLLVTGPIATFVKSQRHWSFSARYAYFAPFIVLGLFLHQAIATPLTESFHFISRTDAVSAVVFAAIFELFVYANFCGLSLVVFGVFGLLGLRIPLNFRQPFSATNLADFWKGWHTTLSTVLKTLFYNPTKKALNTTAALFAVFLSSAMWHGVTFNFVLWGLFHASCYAATIFLLRRRIRAAPVILMFFAVVIGRLLFSDSDTERLLQKLAFEFQGFGVWKDLLALPGVTKLALSLIVLFVGAEFVCRNHAWFRKRNYRFYRLPVVQIVLLGITLATIASNVGVDFAVYGQR